MPDSFFGDNIKFDVIVFNKNSYYKAEIKTFTSKNVNTIANAINYGGIQASSEINIFNKPGKKNNKNKNNKKRKGIVIADFQNDIPYKTIVEAMIKASEMGNVKKINVLYKNKYKEFHSSNILSKSFNDDFYKSFFK